MNALRAFLARSPVLARVAPFAVFVLLTLCQGWFGEAGKYWFYAAKTVVGAVLVWASWPLVTELRINFSLAAVLVGAAVFGLWIGTESTWTTQSGLWAKLGLATTLGLAPKVWNPHEYFGQDSALAWGMVLIRLFGSTVVVPPIEEVFYRSFLYRYLINPDFTSVPLGRFALGPFVLTALVFGFAHREWFAGILCAAAYQGLVIWKNRLGDAIAAHAVTNLLLGIWVV
ncbi:MAG: CAAX prenyl protease-related protein, partial [Verrucomicrobiales bacterium]|nr:CAAX prenyl protease-related protein [Verrucomicrobiales bacterium]